MSNLAEGHKNIQKHPETLLKDGTLLRNAKAAFVIMETVDDAKWIVEHVNGSLSCKSWSETIWQQMLLSGMDLVFACDLGPVDLWSWWNFLWRNNWNTTSRHQACFATRFQSMGNSFRFMSEQSTSYPLGSPWLHVSPGELHSDV